MWLLRKEGENIIHYIKRGEEYTVGRKSCNILITDDKSISRKHATFSIKDEGYIILQDCNAKYFTYVNGIKIQPLTDTQLNENDVVKFGQMQSIYRVEFISDFKVVCTGLSSTVVSNLKIKIGSLNGKLIDKWSWDCTHLTVKETLHITTKACCAIIKGQHIVNLKYWDAVEEAVKHNIKLPIPADYQPRLSELLLGSNADISFNPARQTLFQGKVFVFIVDEYKSNMEPLISCAGGTSISWQSTPITKKDLEKGEFIFVQNIDNSQSNNSFNEMVRYLSTQNLRPIPQAEIALAIILCSCETSCNPKHDPTKNLLGSKNDTYNLYALCSQESDSQLCTQVNRPASFGTAGRNLEAIQETEFDTHTHRNDVSAMETERNTVNVSRRSVIQETPIISQLVPESRVPETILPGVSSVDQQIEEISYRREENPIRRPVSPLQPTFAKKKKDVHNLIIPETLDADFEVPAQERETSRFKKRFANAEEDINESIQMKKKKFGYKETTIGQSQSKSKLSQSSMMSFIQTKASTETKENVSVTVADKELEDNPFKRKRKAAQVADTDKIIKKPNNSLSEKRVSEMNIIDNKATQEKTINSYKQDHSVAEKSTQSMTSESSTSKNRKVSELSKIMGNTCQWLSKNSFKVKKTEGDSLKENATNITVKDEDDPDIIAFAKSFLDCVVIETFDVEAVCNRSKRGLNNTSSRSFLDVSSSKKNFKTFRKAKTIPVTNIMPTSAFIPTLCCEDFNAMINMPEETICEPAVQNPSAVRSFAKSFSSRDSSDDEVDLRDDNFAVPSTSSSFFSSRFKNQSRTSKNSTNVSFLNSTTSSAIPKSSKSNKLTFNF